MPLIKTSQSSDASAGASAAAGGDEAGWDEFLLEPAAPPTRPKFSELCQKLGYAFNQKRLLRQALTRTSAVSEGRPEASDQDYQRLEYLGDQVIGLVISTALFDLHADWKEGQLSQAASDLVRNTALAKLARFLDLGKYLILGKSDELNRVRDNTKVLADVVESIFGAIYLDSGRDLKTIQALVFRHWAVLGLDKPSEVTAKDDSAPGEVEDDLDGELLHYCFGGRLYGGGEAADIEQVLKKGAKANVAGEMKREDDPMPPSFCSALQFALDSIYDHPDCIEDELKKIDLLLTYGADPNWSADYDVIAPEPYPKSQGIFEMLRWSAGRERRLKKYFNQDTALHIIVKKMLKPYSYVTEATVIRLTEMLLEHGALLNLVDANGKTVLQLLYDYRSRNKVKIETCLADAAKDPDYYEKYIDTNYTKLVQLLEEKSVTARPRLLPGQASKIALDQTKQHLIETAFSGMSDDVADMMADQAVAAVSATMGSSSSSQSAVKIVDALFQQGLFESSVGEVGRSVVPAEGQSVASGVGKVEEDDAPDERKSVGREAGK